MAHLLDNPVWHALAGPQRHLAIASGRFRRYAPAVGVFAAVDDPASGLAGIADMLEPSDVVGIVSAASIIVPEGTELVELADVPQMVALTLHAPTASGKIVSLGNAHVEQMLALTALTDPGPFYARTIDTGRYLGIFDADRLVAMAGERMRLPGFTEVSAVCTHPDYQGRGYAKAVTHAVASAIAARGDTPFLHVRAHNAVAIAAYERLGFATRHRMHFTILKRR